MQPIPRGWLAVALLLSATAVSAQTSMTLDDALRRVREQAPAVLAARVRIDEARAELIGASAAFRDNPVVETEVGRRSGGGASGSDLSLGVSQNFELGGRRSLRIDRARANIARETANVEEFTRLYAADVAETFVRALAAKERAVLARSSATITAELLRTMTRRHDAGDVPDLDLNVARIAHARAQSDVAAAEAAYAAAIGALRTLLGLAQENALEVEGDIRRGPPLDLPALLERAQARPELSALRAELDAANADEKLGRSFTLPDVGLRASHQKEGDERVTLGGAFITLPFFQRGQELRAASAARARRVEMEQRAASQRIEAEVRAAWDVWQRTSAAVRVLDTEALPAIADNETLAQRSYEAGAISLPELLILRREALDTRNAYIERLADAATAATDLQIRAGVFP